MLFVRKNGKYGDDANLSLYGRHAHTECRLNV